MDWGPICPDRYGPSLSFSSRTSQEMSLYKPGKSSQRWRAARAKRWVDSGSFYKDISWEAPDKNRRSGPYLSGQIGPAVHLCNNIIISP